MRKRINFIYIFLISTFIILVTDYDTKSEMIDTYELGMEWLEISNEFVLYKFG